MLLSYWYNSQIAFVFVAMNFFSLPTILFFEVVRSFSELKRNRPQSYSIEQ